MYDIFILLFYGDKHIILSYNTYAILYHNLSTVKTKKNKVSVSHCVSSYIYSPMKM